MTESRQEKFSGTKEVAERLRFDIEPLQRYLEDHVQGFSGELIVRQFRGGQSCPTYVLEAGGKSYVLRRKPPGKLLPSAHAVDREYRVMTALGDTDVPVPRTYCLCTDESVVGTVFFVMERVRGRVLWEALLPGMEPRERFAIYDAMNRTLARLHAVEYRDAYCRRTGRDGIPHWNFYLAYNLFRSAGIAQGIAGRVRDGTAASSHAKEVGESVPRTAGLAWDVAQRA